MARRPLLASAILVGAVALAVGPINAQSDGARLDEAQPAIIPGPSTAAIPAVTLPNGSPAAQGSLAASVQMPTASLIKKHAAAPHTTDHAHAKPLDERCKPLEEQLQSALQRPGNAHRLFQARLAFNAGNRLCRVGHADRGMAEFQKGLSYLQENSHP